MIIGDRTTHHLLRFKQAGIGVFRQMADDVPFAAVPVDGLPVPFDLGDPIADTPPHAPPAVVRLPPPPAGAVAVRWHTTTVRSSGWQELVLHWTDPASGEARTSAAHPMWTHSDVHLVFTFGGRPADLWVDSTGALGLLRVDKAEWLVPPP